MKENVNEVGGGDSILRNNYQIFPRVKEKPQTELPQIKSKLIYVSVQFRK